MQSVYLMNEPLSLFLIGCLLLNNPQLYSSILFVCLRPLNSEAGFN